MLIRYEFYYSQEDRGFSISTHKPDLKFSYEEFKQIVVNKLVVIYQKQNFNLARISSGGSPILDDEPKKKANFPYFDYRKYFTEKKIDYFKTFKKIWH